MNSFDRLQKEIDSLTYNARIVMQALQDSVLAAGSSSGFRVVRANKEISLNRVDIYRLYTFYKEWGLNNFSLEDISATSLSKKINGFYTILSNQNKTPVRDDLGNITSGSATSDALAKHGKIMYLTNANVDSYDNDDFWIGLIATAVNPKLVSNTAPIPINLRTPVLDPNLSTKHYNSHPTYLLPSGYYTPDILGYDGDDTDHYLDGKSWSISSNERITINSEKIALGSLEQESQYKNTNNRVGSYATAMGFDTLANGKYSLAAGYKSMASGDYSISIGNKNLASGENAVVIGGISNSSVSKNSTSIGGYGNLALGENSYTCGGSYNSTTEPSYLFELAMYGGGDDVCVATCVDACNGITESNVISNPAYQVLRIKKKYSQIKLSVGDKVVLYDFNVSSTNETPATRLSVNGDSISSLERYIVSIATDTASQNSTILTLNQSVSKSHIVGGSIARKSIYELSDSLVGLNSATIAGEHLIAAGKNQTVVGAYNFYKNSSTWDSTYNARFIVGSGIYNSRKNSLEIYDNAAFMCVNYNRYGSTGYSGIAMGYNKVLSDNTKMYSVDLIWDLNGDTYSKVSLGKQGIVANSFKAAFTTTQTTTFTSSSFTSNSSTFNVNSSSSYITSTSKSYINSPQTTIGDILNSGAAMTIYNSGVVLGYKKSISATGDRNGAFGTFISPMSTGDSFTRFSANGELINPNSVIKTSISEILMPSDSSMYLKSEYPPDTYMGLLDTQYLKKAHLLSFAGTTNSAGNGSIMQMMWGQCTPENIVYDNDKDNANTNAWTGNICVRKGYLEDSGTGVWTTWEPLVTLSDVTSLVGDQFKSVTYSAGDIYKLSQWSSSNGGEWVDSQVSGIEYFKVVFTQSGCLTLMECSYKLKVKPIGDYTVVNAHFVRVVVAVDSTVGDICKPYQRVSGGVVTGEGFMKPTIEQTTYPMYPGYVNGTLNLGTGLSGSYTDDFRDDNTKIELFLPVINENESNDSTYFSGRFVVSYKNLIKVNK